jgi:hypothetical protein
MRGLPAPAPFSTTWNSSPLARKRRWLPHVGSWSDCSTWGVRGKGAPSCGHVVEGRAVSSFRGGGWGDKVPDGKRGL